MPRPLSLEARQKAIDATLELVAEDGISGFTIDGVSKRSGVAKTTLYRHWTSGSELLVHSLDCQVERLPTPDTGSLRGDLNSLMTMLVDIASDTSMRQLMLDLLSAAAKDPELAAVQQAMARERMKPILEVVGRAIERGEIDEADPDLVLMFIEGPLLARMMLSAEPITNEEIPRLIDFIVRGLGAR